MGIGQKCKFCLIDPVRGVDYWVQDEYILFLTLFLFGVFMKKPLIMLLFITLAAGVFAQNTFFSTIIGTELTYTENNAKGKVTGYSRITIISVQGSGANMTIGYESEILDKKRKSFDPRQIVPMTVVVKNNVMSVDMSSMLINAAEEKSIKVDVSGTPTEIPNNIQPGQTLKDAEMSMVFEVGVIKVNSKILQTNGKCEAIENVKVPAGTFTCHKISQTITTTVMKKTQVTRVITWYAPGIGTVKAETYDAKKNKILGSRELVEIKGN